MTENGVLTRRLVCDTFISRDVASAPDRELAPGTIVIRLPWCPGANVKGDENA